MSDRTGIEWTDATWNPVTGCTVVSDGCTNCYAKTFSERFRGTPGHYYENGFDLQLRPEKLDQPLRWRRPRRIFVNSMSDLFHDGVPDEYIAQVWGVMAWSPWHTFQLLTKRHARMRSLIGSPEFKSLVDDAWYDIGRRYELDKRKVAHPGHPYDRWPLPNVWQGVSAENQRWAEIRGEALRATPAAVRFFSCEPMLGPIDLLGDVEKPGPAITRTGWHNPGGPWGPDEYGYDDQVAIDWVIVGGESGPGARPMHPDWARSLRDQCQLAGIAFLFKQWGEWVEDVIDRGSHRVLNVPRDAKNRNRCALHLSGGTALNPDNPFNPFERGHGGWTAMRRPGKRAAGRELDGRTWDEYPEVAAHA
ncbi:DUF5131 family protein [Mycolicibacterium sphagni]|uniref:Phage Gp37/Gp68 family protein n=1 Tax=Mycolicibacterium sphagni TaxID=1786 RepID=A0A255DCK6_9MYCO|nr:phage Gp37/Gp68 family protein [Mycolicibacterium sphagni]OYN76840.1 hypothetical protein CG716_20210 [Mycolicibacterium sphagni]